MIENYSPQKISKYYKKKKISKHVTQYEAKINEYQKKAFKS